MRRLDCRTLLVALALFISHTVHSQIPPEMAPDSNDSLKFEFTGKYKWTESNLRTCDIKLTSAVFAPDPSSRSTLSNLTLTERTLGNDKRQSGR